MRKTWDRPPVAGSSTSIIDKRIAQLYASIDDHIRHYPAGSAARPNAFVFGRAFFPLGSGLWQPDGAVPTDAVAIVGHIFDTPSYDYAIGAGRGSERTERNRTWRGLRLLLERAGVALDDCWLTNALMGIKVGAPCGHVRAGTVFRAACTAFLRAQIETIQPRVVATLGTPAMLVLRDSSDDLRERWRGCQTLSALDRQPVGHVQFDVSVGTHCVGAVVALAHTCSWASTRTYRGERGAHADAALLADAVKATRRSRSVIARDVALRHPLESNIMSLASTDETDQRAAHVTHKNPSQSGLTRNEEHVL